MGSEALETKEVHFSDGDLKFISGRDSKANKVEFVSGFSTTVIDKACNEGVPVVVTGSDDGEALGSDSVVINKLRSIMAVPIKIKEEVIGVLYIDSSLVKGLFKESDLELLSAIGSQIGVAFELERTKRVEIEKNSLQHKLDVQKAVSEMSEKIKILVDHMEQALFAVSVDKVIQGPVSKYTASVMGGEVIGRGLLETLYKDLPRDSEAYTGIVTALETVFGEDDLQWELMEDNFPKKISYTFDGRNRVLSTKCFPVYSADDTVGKIAFIVDDVTDLEKLEKELNQHREEAQLVREQLACDKVQLRDLLERNENLLIEIRNFPEDQSMTSCSQLFARHLHTIKGNSRILGLKSLSSAVHEIESQVLGVHSEGGFQKKSDFEIFLNRVATENEKQKKMLDLLAGGGHSSRGSYGLALEDINRLSATVQKISAVIDNGDYENLARIVQKLTEKSLLETIDTLVPMIEELSSQMGKEVSIDIKCEEALTLSKDVNELLRDCLVHLVRNAVDHGLEDIEERLAAGKGPEGSLEIVASLASADLVKIEIRDDGRGISGEKIGQLALGRGLISQSELQALNLKEKVDLIWLPGFSSKSKASDISGRGIGMDVVKTNVESVGGKLEVATELGQGSTFTIIVPKRY